MAFPYNVDGMPGNLTRLYRLACGIISCILLQVAEPIDMLSEDLLCSQNQTLSSFIEQTYPGTVENFQLSSPRVSHFHSGSFINGLRRCGGR